MLAGLSCDDNLLTSLDLSAACQLFTLSCSNNQLTELDIRPLEFLYELSYDSEKTRLIQRPDQNF